MRPKLLPVRFAGQSPCFIIGRKRLRRMKKAPLGRRTRLRERGKLARIGEKKWNSRINILPFNLAQRHNPGTSNTCQFPEWIQRHAYLHSMRANQPS